MSNFRSAFRSLAMVPQFFAATNPTLANLPAKFVPSTPAPQPRQITIIPPAMEKGDRLTLPHRPLMQLLEKKCDIDLTATSAEGRLINCRVKTFDFP